MSAAKNLKEAIAKTLSAMVHKSPMNFEQILTGELKDYMGHEIMRMQNDSENKDRVPTAEELFNKVFEIQGTSSGSPYFQEKIDRLEEALVVLMKYSREKNMDAEVDYADAIKRANKALGF